MSKSFSTSLLMRISRVPALYLARQIVSTSSNFSNVPSILSSYIFSASDCGLHIALIVSFWVTIQYGVKSMLQSLLRA